MRNVSYFPPYSQEENVVTNAVLLLLSHVNRMAPTIFSDLLTSITDEAFPVGPTFQNQVKVQGGKGIPDALIQQSPFEIYVETKLGDHLSVGQISSHFETIKQNETVKGSSILLGLTRTQIGQTELDELQSLGGANGVRFFSTTFAELADILESSSDEFRLELNTLLEEYRAFIQERGLVPETENKLLINPCGTSYEQNRLHNIYHDQPTRSKVFCKYLGVYKDKCVSLIGEVLAVVNARIEGNEVSILENHPLSWRKGDLHQPTEQELNRILGIVDGSSYYNLGDEEARYYIVDKFVESSFRKVSKHGIQGHRYFTLDGEAGIIPDCFDDAEPTTEDVARALSEKTWQ